MPPDDTLDPKSSIRLADPALLSQRCYIDGRWADAAAGATMYVVNPATGTRIGTAPRMGAAETRLAIEAAATRVSGLAREDGQGAQRRSCADGSS